MSIQERTPLLPKGGQRRSGRASALPVPFPDGEPHESSAVNDSWSAISRRESGAVTIDDAKSFWARQRRWRCVVEQLDLDARSSAAEVPILKFTIGGPAVDPLQRPRARHRSTEPLKGFGAGSKFRERYNETWQCSYPELEENYLTVQLYEAPGCCGKEKFVAMAHVSMKQLATGSTLQRLSLTARGADGRPVLRGKLSFRCRFEEIVKFRVQPQDWVAVNIHLEPSLFRGLPDPAGLPFRFLSFTLGKFSTAPVRSNNPAYPQWKNIPPAFFEGSIVELQSSALTAVLYASNSDEFGADAIELGSAAIPLSSIIEAPYVRAPVVREQFEEVPIPLQQQRVRKGHPTGEPRRTKKKVVAVDKLGLLQGYTQIQSDLPLFQQSSGIPRKKLPHHQYLCVRIDGTENVETTLHSHFRVTAEWRDFVQHTKAHSSKEATSIDQTLYFPIARVDIEDSTSNWYRSGVSILAYECLEDRDECRSYLGGFEIDMKSILSAPLQIQHSSSNSSEFSDTQYEIRNGRSRAHGENAMRGSDRRGGSGPVRGEQRRGPPSGRGGGQEAAKRVRTVKKRLVYLGKEQPFEITVSCWIEPEVPDGVRAQAINSLESVSNYASMTSLSGAESASEYDLISSLRSFEGIKASQGGVLFDLEEAWRKGIPQRLLATCNHRIQMPDEFGRVRFLPTYLARYAVSAGLQTPEQVEATVQRMEWISATSEDTDTLSSLSSDASDSDNEEDEEFEPEQLEIDAASETTGDETSPSAEESEGGEDGGEETPEKEGKRERPEKERSRDEAKKKDAEREERKRERKESMSGADRRASRIDNGVGADPAGPSSRAPYWTGPNTLIRANAGPHPAQVLLHANLLLGLDQDAYVCVGSDHKGNEKVWIMTREADGSVKFWITRKGLHYTLEDRWTGRMDKHSSPGGAQKRQVRRRVTSFLGNRGAAGTSAEARGTRERIFYDEDASVPANEGLFPAVDEEALVAVEKTEERPSITPGLATIEIVFNHRNLWANLQVLDPGRVLYDLELQEQWHPIFRGLQFSRSVESYWGMPFYVPKRLSPPLVPSVAALIVKLLHDKIQFSYVKWRESRGLGTIFDDSLTPVLTEGLYLAQEKREQKAVEKNFRAGDGGSQEHISGGRNSLEERLFAYEQKLDRSAPEGFHISRTLTLNYKFFDPVRVCQELLSQESLHTSSRTCRYGLACLLIPYHNFSCSLWVGLAQLHGND